MVNPPGLICLRPSARARMRGMANVVFMGTPDFAVSSLEALIETQTVAGVVTQPDRPAGRGRKLRPSPVKVVAEAAGIPIYQPNSLRLENAAEPVRAWAPDIIVVAAFGQILRPHLLDFPPHGCLNVHASLLPRWRGAAPIHHALLSGDTETGITLMKMDPGLDTGPIFMQQAISIPPSETAATLHDRLAALGGEMLRQYLDDIVDGRLPLIPQDDAFSTYAPMIKKEDGRLDWSQPAEALARRIKAMTPWPGAFTTWQDKNLRVLSAQVAAESLATGEAGQVVKSKTDDAIIVLTADGGLALSAVQLAGKRATPIQDFVRGRPDFIGCVLI